MEITPQNKKKLEKIATFIKNKDAATIQNFIELDEKLETLDTKIEMGLATISEDLKKKLDEELTYDINADDIRGDPGEDGNNGKDYILTEEDKKAIANSIVIPIVEKVIEKTEVIHEQPIITTQVTNEIKEVAVSDTPEEVTKKINKSPLLIKRDKIEGLSDLERITKENAHQLYTGVSETRVKELIKATPSTPSGGIPGGPLYSIQTNNPLGTFHGDSSFIYDGTEISQKGGAYPDGWLSSSLSGGITLGDLNGDVNNTYFVLDDLGATIAMNASTGINLNSTDVINLNTDNVFSVTSGSYLDGLLGVYNGAGIAFLGDVNGDVNFTYVSVNDSTQFIEMEAVNGYSLLGGVVNIVGGININGSPIIDISREIYWSNGQLLTNSSGFLFDSQGNEITDSGGNTHISNKLYDGSFSAGTSGQIPINTGLGFAWGNVSSAITAGTGLSYSGSTLNSVWTKTGNDIYNNNTGKVGIGTSTPSVNLHVKGDSTSANIAFETATYSTLAYFANYQGATAQFSINRRIDGVFSNTGAAAANMNFVGTTNDSYVTFSTAAANNTNPTERLRIDKNGKVGIGLNTITAALHIMAGTASASTAPLKFTSGTKMTTAEAGAYEYDGNHYLTNAAIRFPVGGILFDHYADIGNTTTTETDLYTDTTAASTLANNGDKIIATYAGIFVSSATATRELKAYFGGTVIFDSGALSISAGSDAWQIDVTIIRESSTVVRCSVIATTAGASLNVYDNYTRVTGLTLSGTNILKITGQAAGVGAATNDIVAKLGTVQYMPAA